MGLSTRTWLLTSAAILTCGTATAQDTFALDEIRVESEAAQEVLGNTAVTEEEIEQRNAQRMSDVFAGQSEITASGGANIAQKVFVHGIEESLLSVTIDGARQNKSAFHHTGNVLIDPFLLKRVEVSSGLAPADAGPGAVAGSIAYETKDARDLLDIGDTFGGNATLSYGDNGETLRTGLTIYGAQGGFEYLLSGVKTEGEDYEDGDGTVVPGTAADTTSYSAKLAYTTDSGHRLEFSAEQTRDTGVRSMQAGPGGLYYARPDFAAVVGRTSVYREALSERNSYSLTWTDETPDGIWAPRVQLAYNEQLVEAGGAIGTNTSLSGTFANEFNLANGVLTAGADFFHDTAEGHGTLNVGNATETLNNFGVFAQMRQDLGSRLSLSYGARADFQTFELADGTEYDDSGVSVSAAADIALTDQLSLNIGAASTWGGYELSEASLINLSGAWSYGTPVASRATNARVGLRFENGPWTANGALFWTEVQDVNDVLTAGRTTADLTTRGVDASLRYDGGRGYVEANYTYADVELDGATIGTTAYYYGRPVGHIIGLSAGFEATPQLTLGGTAEIALENNDTATPLPGYEVLNLHASYTPRAYDALELRLDVRNVFDETYASRAADGLGLANVVQLNEPGRTIALTVNTRF
ncbi:TonB-dependent receptor domain-containing protein [Pseudooceanicola aestuarii]|uniref:TonB-dependent receptor domain-containing protein n=1 Tax=Pseudooceanicola aestuarii TaxID=2697319 RepID=UPI0013D8243E|nr:TonB-dependent receptor [Pseudooceanicola aestuarii]